MWGMFQPLHFQILHGNCSWSLVAGIQPGGPTKPCSSWPCSLTPLSVRRWIILTVARARAPLDQRQSHPLSPNWPLLSHNPLPCITYGLLSSNKSRRNSAIPPPPLSTFTEATNGCTLTWNSLTAEANCSTSVFTSYDKYIPVDGS